MALWEQTKAFLEQHRGENGLVAADAVEQYNRMSQEVQDLGHEIERLERQAEIDAKLAAATSTPIHGNPKAGGVKAEEKPKRPTGTQAYSDAFWNLIRNRGNIVEVRNSLTVGEDTEGGYLVPDEFERTLVQALEEENIFRQLARTIRTSSGDRKIPVVASKGSANWIDEEGLYPEADDVFGQVTIGAYASTYEAKESGDEVKEEKRSVKFSVRYCHETAAVTSTGFRIRFHDEVYNIEAVDPMNYNRKEIRFQCRREARA